MRTPWVRYAVCSLLLPWPIVAQAQQATAIKPPIIEAGPLPLKAVPYAATVKITSVKPGADGKSIVEERAERRMNNGRGRLRTEYGHFAAGVLKTDVVHVKDYVSWTVTVLNPREMTAQIAPLSGAFSEGAIPMPLTPAQAAAAREKEATLRAYRAEHPDHFETEKLPSRTILGIETEGTRSTRVTHEEVNGKYVAVTIVNESWRSPELSLVLLSTDDNPRTGKTISEVTELHRGEPDPKLFELPKEYRVIDPANGRN